MDEKHIKIIVALLVGIALVLVIGLATRISKKSAPIDNALKFGVSGASSTEILTKLQNNKFVQEIPQNATATTPVASAPAAPNVLEKLNFYDMKADKNGFTPSNIAVKNGDLVQIKLTSMDGDYDFSMPYTGMYIFVKKGETRDISFQTTGAGTFLFECRDYCPAGGKIQGEFVVMPK